MRGFLELNREFNSHAWNRDSEGMQRLARELELDANPESEVARERTGCLVLIKALEWLGRDGEVAKLKGRMMQQAIARRHALTHSERADTGKGHSPNNSLFKEFSVYGTNLKEIVLRCDRDELIAFEETLAARLTTIPVDNTVRVYVLGLLSEANQLLGNDVVSSTYQNQIADIKKTWGPR